MKWVFLDLQGQTPMPSKSLAKNMESTLFLVVHVRAEARVPTVNNQAITKGEKITRVIYVVQQSDCVHGKKKTHSLPFTTLGLGLLTCIYNLDFLILQESPGIKTKIPLTLSTVIG